MDKQKQNEITLYEQMNEKIADILAIEKDPSSQYASAYIKDLRTENTRLKEELRTAKVQAVRDFAEYLAEYAKECVENGYEGIGENDIEEKLKEFEQ